MDILVKYYTLVQFAETTSKGDKLPLSEKFHLLLGRRKVKRKCHIIISRTFPAENAFAKMMEMAISNKLQISKEIILIERRRKFDVLIGFLKRLKKYKF